MINTLNTTRSRRRILSPVVAMAVTGAVLASSSYAAAPADTPAGESSADSKRIVVILKETADLFPLLIGLVTKDGEYPDGAVASF